MGFFKGKKKASAADAAEGNRKKSTGSRKSVTYTAPAEGEYVFPALPPETKPGDGGPGPGRPRSSFARRKSHIVRRATIHDRKHPEERHYVAFYRNYAQALPAAIQSHGRFFPWPPQRTVYFTSGYYRHWYDLSVLHEEIDSFDTDTLRVHNVPSSTTEDEIRDDFNGDPAVLLGNPTYVKYQDSGEAKDAFKKTRHIRIAQGDLLYLRGNDFYVTHIPKNTTPQHMKRLYPNADEVKVVHNGPAGRSYAYVHYPDQADRDTDYENGPLPIGQGGTIDGRDAVRRDKVIAKSPKPQANEVWIIGIPKKGVKPEDFDRFFPGNESVTFARAKKLRDRMTGGGRYVIVKYPNNGEARDGAARASPSYFRNIGPRQFQLIKRPPAREDIVENEIEGLPDEELARTLWQIPKDQDLGTAAEEHHFTPTLTVTGLPKETTVKEIQQMFPGSKSIQVEKQDKNHIQAIIEFADPLTAAQAFSKAKELNNTEVHVITRDIGGGGGAAAAAAGDRRKSRRITRRVIRRTIIRRPTIVRRSSRIIVGEPETTTSKTSVTRRSIKSRKSRKSIKSKGRGSVKSKKSVTRKGSKKSVTSTAGPAGPKKGKKSIRKISKVEAEEAPP